MSLKASRRLFYLEVQDNVPDKVENNRRDAVSNTRGIDAKKLNLEDDVTVSTVSVLQQILLY